MRVTACLVALLALPLHADAAEVVWLQEPAPDDAARIAARAGATRGPLDVATFRGILAAPPADPRTAIDEVADALETVRVHETVLDGEKLILTGLEGPLNDITFLPDTDDRETVIRALLYQGFAADRFWGTHFGTAPDAAPWRIVVDNTPVERPWLDAFALDPLRRADEDDIGEAPQRASFEALRKTLAGVTRATLLAPDLPPDATVYIDGEPQRAFTSTTVVELLPGRHWLHATLDGTVIAREALRLAPGERHELAIDVPETAWRDFLRVVRTGEGRIPTPIVPVLEALSGEVWIADGAGDAVRAWRVRPSGVQAVPLGDARPASPSTGALADVSVAVWAGPTWLHSPDFREQDPSAVPDSAGVINAVAPVGGLELAWDRDWLRYGLGVDATLPLGRHHVALSGAGRYRLRTTPYLLVGHPLVQATFGLLVPYHLVGGIQGTLDGASLGIDAPLELRARVRGGDAPTRTRVDGTAWRGGAIVQASLGLGIRLRP